MIFVTMEEELIVCQLSRTLPVQKTKQYTKNTTAPSTAEKRRGKSITIKSLENLLDLARTALAVHEDPHDHLLRRQRRKRRGLLLLLLPSSPLVLLLLRLLGLVGRGRRLLRLLLLHQRTHKTKHIKIFPHLSQSQSIGAKKPQALPRPWFGLLCSALNVLEFSFSQSRRGLWRVSESE